ncbi:MAG: hypothetical protein QXT98_01305 [Archaeoglobaceae archaeon]
MMYEEIEFECNESIEWVNINFNLSNLNETSVLRSYKIIQGENCSITLNNNKSFEECAKENININETINNLSIKFKPKFNSDILVELEGALENKKINKTIKITSMKIFDNPYPYYIKISEKFVRDNQIQFVSYESKKLRVNDSFWLFDEIFWPIGSKEAIICLVAKNTSGEIEQYYILKDEIVIPICGIGSIAILSICIIVSTYLIQKGRLKPPKRSFKKLDIPEHLEFA